MDSPLTTAPHKPLSFGKSTGDTTFHNAPVELFPERVSKPMEESKKSLAERIQDDGGARELFPELVSGPGGGRRRRRKAEDHF
jgi:hypothetical protein